MMPKVKIQPMPLQPQSNFQGLTHVTTISHVSNFKKINNITQLHNFILKSIENVVNFIVCFNSY